METAAVANTMTTALTTVGTLTTQALGIITGNDILMVLFCGGLLGVGFRVIRQAKASAM